MTFSGSSRVVRVPMTQDKDLILTMDFDKKIIEVESDHWTTIAKRKGLESPDIVATESIPATTTQKKDYRIGTDTIKDTLRSITRENNLTVSAPAEAAEGGNKKVQLSNEEKTLIKIIEIFDSLAATSFNENSVNSKVLQNHLLAKNIIGRGEFNKYLNMLLSNDIIEYVEDAHLRGFYKRKNKQNA